MTQIIRKNTNAGDNEKKFTRQDVPASFQLDGVLSGAEEVTFQLIGINGIDLTPWVDEFEDPIKFTATQTRPIPVFSPLDLKITKPITVNAVGVKLVG